VVHYSFIAGTDRIVASLAASAAPTGTAASVTVARQTVKQINELDVQLTTLQRTVL
jgi:hypothetical protein